MRVQDKPVVLMYGGTPMYRAIGSGVSDGADVRALEANLKALGYGDDLTVDEEFTSATAAAIREWQDDKGLDETGRVDSKQVVFLPRAVRVKSVAPEGKKVAAGQPVMTVAGTRRIVHLDLDAGEQDMAVKGAKVSVELPGGKVAGGRIASVATIAENTGTEQNPQTTVDVEITLDRGADTGRLDQAPVTVELESERREGVLSVPIEALLGLREGGFGVEVVEGTAKRIVPVTTGAFGGGRVEVSGTGLAPGMRVGVPSGE